MIAPVDTGKNEKPKYSAAAKRKGVEGTVVVAFEVLEDGSVANPQILSGPPHSPAMTAAKLDSAPSLEETILALCAGSKPGQTINPTDAAQAFAAASGEGELGWRAHLPVGIRQLRGDNYEEVPF